MKTKLELTIVAGTDPSDFFDPINAPLLEALSKYLVSEFSSENLLFAKAVQDFKESESRMTKAQLNAKVVEIYNQYISETAPSQINIDDKTRKMIKANLSETDIHIFDNAFEIIEKMISRDSMKRFILTPGYQEALKKIAPVQKEYDAISAAYEKQPKNKRSDFIFGLLKQSISDFDNVEKDIARYSSGNVFVKSHKKLHIAYDKKHDLLIRQRALEAFIANKFPPTTQVELAKQKVQLSQAALDRAEENLAQVLDLPSVENADGLLLKIANQEVDEAQAEVTEAVKELDKRTEDRDSTVKVLQGKQPILMTQFPAETKGMGMSLENKGADTDNDTLLRPRR